MLGFGEQDAGEEGRSKGSPEESTYLGVSSLVFLTKCYSGDHGKHGGEEGWEWDYSGEVCKRGTNWETQTQMYIDTSAKE